jgi:hypothetical protein
MPSPEDFLKSISTPITEMMDKHGLGLERRIKQLKAEFKAYTPEIIKFDGKLPKNFILPKGFRIVAQDKFKTIIEAKRIDMGVRQRARMDAHKLAGDYPSEKIELNPSGKPVTFHVVFDEKA